MDSRSSRASADSSGVELTLNPEVVGRAAEIMIPFQSFDVYGAAYVYRLRSGSGQATAGAW